MANRKQLIVNMAATVSALLTGFVVNFFLTPYLVENVGVESYGFFKLASDFSSYALVFTFLVNSMTGRFVAINWHRGLASEASRYFSSSVVANTVLVAMLSIPLFFGVSRLENLVDISPELVIDVKTLVFLIMTNWAIMTLFASFTSGYYARNRLDISSYVTVATAVLYVGLLLIMYGTRQPKVSYVGVATLAVGIVTVASNVVFQRRLLPGVNFNVKLFDFTAFKALLSASSWNSLNRISAILLEGLDLLFANIFLGPTAMAIVAVAKTVPGLVKNLSATMVRTFSPSLTALWAKNQTAELNYELSFGMRIVSLAIVIPIAGFVVVGEDFYSLWLPSMDSALLYRLSLLVLVITAIVAPIEMLLNVFVTANRVKIPALVMFLSGIVSVVSVLLALRFTSLGIWAIISASSFMALARELGFTPWYASKVLGISAREFYVIMGRTVLALVLSALVGEISKSVIGLDRNWISLVLFTMYLTGALSIVSAFVMLDVGERHVLLRRLIRVASGWWRW